MKNILNSVRNLGLRKYPDFKVFKNLCKMGTMTSGKEILVNLNMLHLKIGLLSMNGESKSREVQTLQNLFQKQFLKTEHLVYP